MKSRENGRNSSRGEISRSVNRYLSSIIGEAEMEKYKNFINEEPVVYIRVNRLKTTAEILQKKLLTRYGIETEPLKDIPFALKTIKGKELTGKTVEHIIGDYYIQGLSSMLPPLVLSPGQTDKVLDLAAAPGSKTTGMGEIMNNKGVLVANEISLDRVKMLVYNLDRMNIINYGVLHFKGELLSKLYSNYFDKILVDAPCSGLGIIQKKGEVNEWWSKEKAEILGDLQTRLLISAIKMLKPGGELVYSTCTLTVEENEVIIDKMLRKYPVETAEIYLPVKSHQAFTEYEGIKLHQGLANARRIIPWEVNSDGFFIVKMIKTDETLTSGKLELHKPDIKLLTSSSRHIRNLLKSITEDFGIAEEVLDDYKYLKKGTDIFFVSKEWEEENIGVFERVGTKFGTVDKTERLTFHTQAAQVLQKNITKNIIDIEETGDLKKYLEGGIIKKDSGMKGQCVLKFGDSIIGTAIITEAGIKSRFPRSKRTQEIIV